MRYRRLVRVVRHDVYRAFTLKAYALAGKAARLVSRCQDIRRYGAIDAAVFLFDRVYTARLVFSARIMNLVCR